MADGQLHAIKKRKKAKVFAVQRADIPNMKKSSFKTGMKGMV